MHFIAYNALRLLIVDAADASHQPSRSISFKGSIQALRQWTPQFCRFHNDPPERRRLMGLLREAIGANQVVPRPGRREPRCVKRRPKPFALLTAPRHQMIETPHRHRYRATTA